MPRVFSSTEIGRLLGVDPSSVNRWIDAGRLRAHRTPGGHRRVLEPDLLSFVEAQQLPVPEELSPPPAVALEELFVLLCDADQQHVEGLSRSLKRARPSLQVIGCGTPLEGLLRIGVYRPHLALLDVQMAGLDWVEVCRTILGTAETADTRVLTCAARPTAALEAKLRKAGALGLLAKPVKAASLLEALAAIPAG